MASKSGPPDAKALSCAAKGLRDASAKGVESSYTSPSDAAEAKNILSSLEELYDKFQGDISKIFDSFNESPRKALKHPPKDAKDFARKYYEGYYTIDIGGEGPTTAPGK